MWSPPPWSTTPWFAPFTGLLRRVWKLSWVQGDRSGLVDSRQISAAIRPNTRLVALSHCSNVTGTIQPIEEIALLARKAGALFLLDAAQSAGGLPIDVREMMIDLLAVPGHKGLFGPQGTGFLYIAEGVETDPPPGRGDRGAVIRSRSADPQCPNGSRAAPSIPPALPD